MQRKIALLSPVSPTERDNGLTLPLRHVISACESAGDLTLWEGVRARPSFSALVSTTVGQDCFSSAALKSGSSNLTSQMQSNYCDVAIGFLGSTASTILQLRAPRKICIVQDSILRISRHNGRYDNLPTFTRQILDFTNRRYESNVYSKLDAIVVTSESEKSFLAGIGVQCQIMVNPNGVDLPMNLPQSSFDYDVVMLGNYSDYRNVQIAKRGFQVVSEISRLLDRRPRVLVVGWNAEQIDIPELDAEVELLSNVDDVYSAVSHARCFFDHRS